MLQLIDSHFHSILMHENGQNTASAWSSICSGIDVGTVFDDLPRRHELLHSQAHIQLSAAMGPWETMNSTFEDIDSKFEILKHNIKKYDPLFIGEAGLDNYCQGYGDREIQEYLFIKNIEIADSLGKKIIIHNREADEQMVRILKEHSPLKAGIIHCFSGNTDVMKTALDNGFYISYAGNVTYKSNGNLRETLKYVPSDRLLVETDSPYLTPVPKRGEKNSPEYIINTYNCIAEVLSKSVEKLSDEVFNNFSEVCKN